MSARLVWSVGKLSFVSDPKLVSKIEETGIAWRCRFFCAQVITLFSSSSKRMDGVNRVGCIQMGGVAHHVRIGT